MAGSKEGFIPKRYILSMLIFLGFFTMYGLRVNLNVAIGAMAKNHTAIVDGKPTTEEPEFQWSSRLQGVVLGSFYYGYIALQILGGWLALQIGATRLYGFSLFLASLLTLLTPLATRASVYMLIIVRIVEGLVLGVMFPCNHAIWSKWAPSMERATLLGLSIAGCTTGSVAAMPISGLLTMTGLDGGWPIVFYFFGAIGVLWYGLWVYFIYESPSVHPTISIKEREFIEETAVSADEMRGKVPWRQLLTSRRVWAITAAAFAGDWCLYVLLICIPLYLLDVIHYDLHKMAFAAAVPFLFKSISCPLAGCFSDCLLRRGYVNVLTARRLFFSIGATASIYIVLTGYTEDRYLVVGWIALAGFSSGFAYAGFHVNMLDIAPRNASIIMGLCNTVGGTTGFITPMMVGFLTRNRTAEEWRTVFWMTFIIYTSGATIFCIFISDVRQDWDKPNFTLLPSNEPINTHEQTEQSDSSEKKKDYEKAGES